MIRTISRKKTTKWNLVIRYCSITLAIVSGVVMVPLYLKFIPLDIYGAWLASGNILVWLSFIDPGLTVVLQQQIGFAYGKRDYQSLREIIFGGLLISTLISVTIIIIGLLLAPYLPLFLNIAHTNVSNNIIQAFSLAVIGTSLTLLSFSISAVNIGLQNSIGVGLISISVTLLSTILIAVLLFNGFGLLAIAYASVFSGVLYTLGQAIYLSRRLVVEKIGFKVTFNNFKYLTKILSYSFLGRSASTLANNLDLLVVSQFLRPETVSVLAISRKVPDISKEFINQPSVAFQPAISHLMGSGEIEKARNTLTRLIRILYWMLCLVVGGLIALNDNFVTLWVGPHIFVGTSINLILCITLFFTVATACLRNICTALGDIKGNSIATLAQSLLFIPLVIFGTKYFGLIGAVLAPLISTLAVSVWYYPKSFSKLLNLSFKDYKSYLFETILPLVAMLVLAFGFSLFQINDWLRFFFFLFLYCTLFVCFLYLASKNFRKEINEIINWMRINFRN